jgi:Rod binding domain-containing protein
VGSDLGGIAANAFSQFADAKTSSASKQAQLLGGTSDSQKINKSASDFESILLASWLESAEKSFATAPGGEDDPNADPGKSQFQSYAVQAVASALTKAGGIGIAAMIASGLEKRANLDHSPEAAADAGMGIGDSAVKEKK